MDGNNASVMQQVINEPLDRGLLRRTIGSHQQIAMGVPRKPLEAEGHVTVVAPQDLKPEQAVRALMRRASRHAVMISATACHIGLCLTDQRTDDKPYLT